MARGPENLLSKNGTSGRTVPVSPLPPLRRHNPNMKRTTLSLLCLASLTFSVFAEDNTTPAADNSGRNERDRSGETKTPIDQSNSAADTEMTAAIRRAVMQDDSLSMSAKNVKIITADGVVTLRGPVKTAAEKAAIEKHAQSIGNAKIENQIEVEAAK